MNSILVLVVGIGILIAGYVFYGKWLAEQWGVDPKRKTPAFTEEDGVDYVPAKARRPDQRTDSGRCLWMGSGSFMGTHRRYLLWRRS